MRTLIKILPLFFATLSIAQNQIADLVFTHAKVWTVDKAKPTAEAVAVLGSKILAVGTNTEIQKFVGSQTRLVDAKEKRMMPGFIDNHTHFMSGGFQLQNVDLRYAKNEAEFARLIKERAERYPKRWMTGGDWDHDNWPGGNLPTKELLDRDTPETPVFVNRYDGHMALANSYVLKLAGITKNTPNPTGGTIVKDPKTGEPTGVLKDEAMSLVYRLVPDATEEEMLDAARLALAEVRKFGVTSIQDVSSSADLRIYQKLKEQGALTARFYCRLPIGQWDNLAAVGIEAPFGNEWIRLGSLKGFADGSLGSSTALFFEPFTSDPSTHGLAMDVLLDGKMEQWATGADKAGLQLSIHAIGDSANSLMLNMFERIIKTNPRWDRRFRIEHAQHIHPKDFKRFAQLGVIASVQPYHAIDDGRWAEKRIGHERCRTTYPFRTFLDNGVKMCFGSDWTVAPLNPLLGVYAAVTRRTTDGATPNGWFPEQKISVQEAVEAYTINNAYAAYEENEKGSITVGKLADLVVLEEDILSIDPVKIEKVEVAMTVVGGKIVYEKAPMTSKPIKESTMKRATGIGGIFFKAQDPKGLKEWYDKHLGITPAGDWGSVFVWRAADEPNATGQTVWSIFSSDTKYLNPSKAPFMVNYRVENLHWLLEQLRKEGVQVDDKVEESEFGKFAWVIDPEGNKIELWEPPKESASEGGIPMK